MIHWAATVGMHNEASARQRCLTYVVAWRDLGCGSHATQAIASVGPHNVASISQP
jgi:hypothetical protein